MKKCLCILLPIVFMLSACTFLSSRNPIDLEAARPVKMDGAKSEAVIKEIAKDRADADEWLHSNPNSYLAAIDRFDFGEKPALTIGTADDNDVRLSGAEIKPHHLKIKVDGDQFRIDAIDSNATFRIKDKDLREVTTDPTAIQVGRFHLRLSHQRSPAIIVFDPQSPRMKDYKGFAYFPIDLSYRYELPLTRNPRPEKINIMSTRGNRRSAELVGWFDFFVGDTPCRLEATRLLEPGGGESEVSVFFRDATSGKETYQLGRYADAKKLDNGNYLLDFNSAYNPACAFSEYYNCPIPPKENTLKVAIRAGEMDSHYH